ncbi:MAG TPA: GNAT family N-acetyltransferase [Terriglobales bacterium]|nr:GNAT family N-acetyltransferase [Terriglobales bacterium]
MLEKLRPMTADDIPSALGLSTEAGWNQTADDWKMLLELAPNSCFAIEVEGTLAASTTLLCYGCKLAWIGMVLTTEKYRGRGFARRLLEEALTHADRRKIESVKLDATDQGRPLYETMGFRFEQPVERWAKGGSGDFPRNVESNWPDDPEDVFGADRSQLLNKLAERNPPLTTSRSYLFTRPGRQTNHFGPGVGESPEDARTLAERALQSGSWYWDLLPNNTNAVALAEDLGFAPQRHLSRMVRGKDLRGKEGAIYAIAGFELG